MQKYNGPAPSVSARAAKLVDSIAADASALRCSVTTGGAGERLIDMGASVPGGLEAGRRLGEVCMGGLGTVSLHMSSPLKRWPLGVTVHASNPVIACLGSQYAGWSITEQESGFFALGSGPARALSRVEALYKDLGYVDHHSKASLVIEGDKAPPTSVVRQIASACGVQPSDLTILFAPTGSLAGTVQIAARVLEVALHKAHELHFPLEHIEDGIGTAPIAPPIPDFVKAMGRTNDAIIYGGRVQLFVRGADEPAQKLAAAAAQLHVLGLRQAVCRDLRRRRRRLLQDRSHAVQPRRGDRLQPRYRLILPCWRTCSRRRRRKLPLSSPQAGCALRSSSRRKAATGMCAVSPRRCARAASTSSSARCRAARSTRGSPSGIDIPGFDGELPDAVFVRSISQGTLEQITFRLGILHALRESGVRVWNDARAIERCVDKSATTFLLHKAGIPTPRTRTMETKPPADAYVADAGRPLIYKPLFGIAGQRPAAHRRSAASCRRRRPPTTSTTCRISCRPQARASRTGASSSPATASSPPWRAGPAPGSPTCTRAASRARTSRARRWRSWPPARLRRSAPTTPASI